MKALLTGLNGTVAPVLAQALVKAGHTVVAWDRARVPTDNAQAASEFIRDERPDWFCHIATGSPDWAECVAQVCAREGVKFLFTSSVSVFAAAQRGPFMVDAIPQPADDYGHYKFNCEKRVRAANPEALVVRLGWQIGTAPGGNQMVDYLERSFQAQGRLAASTKWYQACSFLTDTADGLAYCMETQPGGLYHLDGNPGLNFYEVVLGLNRLLGQRWRVTPSDSPVQNNLLQDDRLHVNPITRRFPAMNKT
jgi:dTDP-4-dehydrorhamnose reductase